MNWSVWIPRVAIGLLLIAALSFSAGVTARLAQNEAKLQANLVTEPQMADPLQTYVEVALPLPPMPLLSAGYQGIAPGMHFIQLNTNLPLSNIDQIENPARRRYGRVDVSFAILYAFPLAWLAIGLLLAQQLRSGLAAPAARRRLFDTVVESLGLPLAAWLAVTLAALLAALYANGLQLKTNEDILRFGAWLAAATLYSSFWLLALLWLLLRTRSLERSALAYAALYLLLTLLAPSVLQSLALAVAQPEVRLALTAERRQRSQLNSRSDAALARRLIASAGSSLDFDSLPPRAQRVVTTLALEQELRPRVDAYLDGLRRYEEVELLLQWTNPLTLTQTLMDDLGGTGLRRYAAFREQVSTFADAWRKHLLPRLLNQQPLDYDALRATPRFAFREEAASALWLRTLGGLLLLAVLCAGLALLSWRAWTSESTNKNATP